MGRILASDNALSVGANAESVEQLGSDKIRMPESGTLVLMASSTVADTSCKFLVGGDAIIDAAEIHQAATADLQYPDDVIVQARVSKGDAVSLKFRAVTAATVTYRLMLS